MYDKLHAATEFSWANVKGMAGRFSDIVESIFRIDDPKCAW